MTYEAAQWQITNINIIGEDSIFKGSVQVREGRICGIYSSEADSVTVENMPSIDGENGWLMPGFIDVHVHGGFGADFMDANMDAYDTITRFHAHHGTTTMLATTVTAPKPSIDAVLEAVNDYRSRSPKGAKLAGVHLEGPFISPLRPGAQNPIHIGDPNLEWVKEWNSAWPGLISILTLAPESSGALDLIRWLKEYGITASCGHTDADYKTIMNAVPHGLSHAVHAYNAMRGLHHREPGAIGAVLDCDTVSTEIIADGKHVHPAAIRLLMRAKPADKLLLITDCMAAGGLGDGDYQLGGMSVTVQDGTARLAGTRTLAGSTLTMITAVRYMLENSGLPIWQISNLASGNPARMLGIYGQTGSIHPGKQADLVWIDSSLNVRGTWVDGIPVQ